MTTVHAAGQTFDVRRARPDEVVDLRWRVLRDGLPRTTAIFDGDDELTTLHYVAAAGDRVACCATFHLNHWDGEPAYQLRGMASADGHRGAGLGRAVLALAEADVRRESVIRLLWCNARTPAVPFYQRLGWAVRTDVFEIPTAGPHVKMTKRLVEDAPAATPQLVLASGSPRRLELLRAAGYTFAVHPADIDESDVPPDLEPAEVAALLARRKGDVVAARFPADVTLSADTVVAVGRRTLGKAADAADARRILRLLSGTRHEVITAVRVCRPATGQDLARVVRSSVEMRRLTDAELDAYVAGGQWEGKAGAYGIQDDDPFVIRIDGSLTNIVGLPMDETREMLDAVLRGAANEVRRLSS